MLIHDDGFHVSAASGSSAEEDEQTKHKRTKVYELERLLYAMTTPPYDEMRPSTPWNAILMRAQHCQALYHSHVAQFGRGDHDDHLAQRVDHACRRAHAIAEQRRLQQQQQQDRDQHESDRATAAMVQRLFFSSGGDAAQALINAGGGGGMPGDGGKHITDDDQDAGYDDDTETETEGNDFDFDDDDDDGDDNNGSSNFDDSMHPTHSSHSQDTVRRSNNADGISHSHNHNHNHSSKQDSNAASSLTTGTTKPPPPPSTVEDLQKVQREQMEAAISMMAEQMKEATKDIHSKIRRQTQGVLNEMEDTVAQNVSQVEQATQKVKAHVAEGRKRSFNTYATIIALVGIFLFSLMTIFTIPKHPRACLLFCGSSRKHYIDNDNDSNKKRRRRQRWSNDDDHYYHDDDDNNNEGGGSDQEQQHKDEDDPDIYDEYEEQLREKERLNELLKTMEDEKFGGDGNNDEPNDVDARDAMIASLNEMAKDGGDIKIDVAAQSFQHPHDPDIDYIYEKAEAKTEEIVKADKRFSPKDVRVAAAKGDADLMKQYLEMKPEYKDLPDKQGWNPLHFAVSRGHERVADLLLRAGVDVESITKDGVSALEMAIGKWGSDHDVTRVLLKAGATRKHPVHTEQVNQEQQETQQHEDETEEQHDDSMNDNEQDATTENSQNEETYNDHRNEL